MAKKKKKQSEALEAIEAIKSAGETAELVEEIGVIDMSMLAIESAEEPMIEEEEQILAEGEVFDESKLLELAQNEGLIDVPSEEPIETEVVEIDLPENEQAELMASMETILFMSDKPVSLPKLRSTINSDVKLAIYRQLMARLRAEFALDHRGVEIAEVSMGFQLRTKPHMANVLRKMIKTQPMKLSGTTLEVLAIIAYKQPLTKDEIDQIRGVDSGYVLRNLMEKRLVKIAGRSELPGKPMIYGTTHEFLELFNLKDQTSLPPLHEVEAMVAASEVGFEEKTQAVMDEFGKMVESNTKVLFDDSQIDDELEALRSEIANIPTSTWFIDFQKAKDKLQAKLAALASQGLTLDASGNEVPLDSVPADTALQALEAKYAAIREKAEALEAAPAEHHNDEPMPTELPLATSSAIIADTEVALQVNATIQQAEHVPSSELEAAAADAQWERHAAMIAQAVTESATETEVAVVNAEALADAVTEAKIEQELDAQAQAEENPEV